VRRRLLWAALVAYLVAGVLLTLSPSNLFDDEFRRWRLDVPVNLVMFMPPVALLLLLHRRLPAWVPVAVVAVASVLIEVVQKLSPRDSSWGDVLLNVAGAALAAGAVAAGRLRRRAP
jgi:glycopeptide antibiotics resistance protein